MGGEVLNEEEKINILQLCQDIDLNNAKRLKGRTTSFICCWDRDEYNEKREHKVKMHPFFDEKEEEVGLFGQCEHCGKWYYYLNHD